MQLDRASLLKMIRRNLIEAGIDTRSCRVDRYVRCYQVSRLFGGDAEKLSFSALREMQPLVERERTGEAWQIVPDYEPAAKSLWARMLGEHLSADVVRMEVHKILPAKSLSIRRHRPIKVGFVLKLLPRIPAADLATLEARIAELKAKSLFGGEKVA